jgi:hypothetical protein
VVKENIKTPDPFTGPQLPRGNEIVKEHSANYAKDLA